MGSTEYSSRGARNGAIKMNQPAIGIRSEDIIRLNNHTGASGSSIGILALSTSSYAYAVWELDDRDRHILSSWLHLGIVSFALSDFDGSALVNWSFSMKSFVVDDVVP